MPYCGFAIWCVVQQIVLRWPTQRYALAIAAYCLFLSSITASVIAVYLYLPLQYIFICLCSISALSLTVLLLWETYIMKKYGHNSGIKHNPN